jgi:hypothetical protein
MLFALVLGLLVGGAAVLLLQQWLTAALAEPTRTITPSGSFIIEHPRSRRRAA